MLTPIRANKDIIYKFLSTAQRKDHIITMVKSTEINSNEEITVPAWKKILASGMASAALLSLTACGPGTVKAEPKPIDTPTAPANPNTTPSATPEVVPTPSAKTPEKIAEYKYVSGQVIRAGIDKGDVSDIYNSSQDALIPEINGTNKVLFEKYRPVTITESQIRGGELPQEYGERVAALVSGYYSTKGGTVSSDMTNEKIAEVAPDRTSYLLCALGAESRTDTGFTNIFLKTPYNEELFSPKILSSADFQKVEDKLGRKEVKPESTVLFGANATVIDANGITKEGKTNIYIHLTGVNMYDGDALRATGTKMGALKDSGLPLIGATIQVQGRLVPSDKGDDYEFRAEGINILGSSKSLVRNENETIGNDGKIKKLDKYGNPVNS